MNKLKKFFTNLSKTNALILSLWSVVGIFTIIFIIFVSVWPSAVTMHANIIAAIALLWAASLVIAIFGTLILYNKNKKGGEI